MTSLVTVAEVLDRSLAVQAQLADWDVRSKQVAEYRNFYDGDHPANMTAEMRKLLRVKSNLSGGEFNDNYMQIVVDTMSDRIALDTITADNDEATDWAQQVLEDNDGDALQGDVNEAAIRDGETFLMASWDNDEQRVVLTHELAYDGTSGMLVLYQSQDMPVIEAAIKIWVLTAENGAISDIVRMNVYYPDRICKFISRSGDGNFVPYDDPTMPAEAKPGEYAWITADGEPIGIPIVPFRNKGRKNQGLSELANAIPLQNVLNRLLHSIVMTSELDAFRIKWIKGAPAPRDLTPGMVVAIGQDGLTQEQAAAIDLGEWAAGDMSQQLATAQWVTNEIGKVTRTPAPEFAGGDNASGEALKQREIGLLGKVKRYQVKASQSWINVMKLAWAIQAAYGGMKGDYTRFYVEWKSAEIRNEQADIDDAIKLQPYVDRRTFLEMIANIKDWDAKKIDKIMQALDSEKMQQPTTGAPPNDSVANNGSTPAEMMQSEDGASVYTPKAQADIVNFYRTMKESMNGSG